MERTSPIAALALVAGLAATATAGPPLEATVQTGHADAILDVALSRDGRLLATASQDNSAVLWEVATARQLRRLSHPYWARSVAFDPSGRVVVVGGDRGEVRLWDVATGALVKELRPGGSTTYAVAFSPDGKHLLTGQSGGRVQVWSAPFDAPQRTLEGLGEVDRPTHFSFDAAGRWVAVGGHSGAVAVFDLASGERGFQTQSSGEIVGVALSLDGAKVLVGRRHEPYVDVYDRASGRQEATHRTRFGGDRLVRSADGQSVFLGRVQLSLAGVELSVADGGNPVAETREGALRVTIDGPKAELWDVKTKRRLRTFEKRALQPGPLAVSPDGRWLLVGGEAGRRWDLSLGRDVGPIDPDEGGRLLAVAYSPSGRLAASVGLGGRLGVYAMPEGRPLHALEAGDGGALGFAADDRTLYTADTSQRGLLWDAVAGRRLRAVAGGSDLDRPTTVLLPDGRRAIRGDGDGRLALLDLEAGAVQKEVVFDEGRWSVRVLAVSRDGRLVAAGGSKGLVKVLRADDLTLVRELPRHGNGLRALAFDRAGRRLIAGDADGVAQVFDVSTGQELARLAGHARAVVGAVFFEPDPAPPGLPARAITASEDGAVRIWDLAAPAELLRLVSLPSGEYAAVAPDGAYSVSPGAASGTHFVVGTRTYSFDNFDLRFNRPDVLIERLGLADPEILAGYRAARAKRLARMGVSAAQLDGDLELPDVKLVSADLPLRTEARQVSLTVEAKDPRSPLDRLQVYVNEVPIFGRKGRPVAGKRSTVRDTFTVELAVGRNRIEVSALNRRGAESPRETVEIDRVGPATSGRTLVVALGVSDYRDDAYDLSYAAKDAADLAAVLAGADAPPTVLLDGAVTAEALAKVKSELARSTVDDRVVVFFAGHGLLDASFDYYLATAATDFQAPRTGSLPYSLLEELFDGIPARRRLLLLDACHSGEVDKDEVKVAQAVPPPKEGKLVARGLGRVAARPRRLGLSSSFELMRELFADVRRGTGAAVLSSASGAEFALESDAWKNGVFTYSILEALRARRGDLDRDGTIRVSELERYVRRRVVELTAGRQNPTSRASNRFDDFAL